MLQKILALERGVLKMFGGGCHLPLGVYCRRDDGKFQVFTSKADDGDGFPDRFFIESDTLDGVADKIVARFAKGPEVPKKCLSREISRTPAISARRWRNIR
jgi:hydroxymethylbilane synthase